MKDLRDRVAVVTGGASGIGLGMARALAGAGARLVIADIEVEPLEAAAAGLREAGAQAIAVACDVSVPASLDALRDETLETYGAVHVLCNNAGVGGATPAPIWDQPADEWDWVMGVNLQGVVHGIQRFVPVMIEQGSGGHVINTASMAGLLEGGGVYGVSKHAVVALSEAMYRDARLRGLPIGVSVLCPGWVNTRILESERNRPEAPRETVEAADPLMEQTRALVTRQVEQGMPPEEVGEIVLDAIRNERFYILTHAWQAMIRNRMEHILAGENPEGLMPPGMGGEPDRNPSSRSRPERRAAPPCAAAACRCGREGQAAVSVTRARGIPWRPPVRGDPAGRRDNRAPCPGAPQEPAAVEADRPLREPNPGLRSRDPAPRLQEKPVERQRADESRP